MARTILEREGLDQYYELGGGKAKQPARVGSRRDRKWVEPVAEALKRSAGVVHLDLDVQGIHCAACVWLIERWFSRMPGAIRIVVNPALGQARLAITPAFALERLVADLERFGYVLGPAKKGAKDATDEAAADLILRMGVCIAVAMNTMLFAIAIYAGVEEGPILRLFHRLTFGLSAVSVVVGGPVFFRAAWRGLRRRVLHLDLPISLGIVLAFAGSALSYALEDHPTVYFDTLSTFIALMLVGRLLQERVIAGNRNRLLSADDAEALLVRRIRDGAVETVRASTVERGDRLLVSPGDVLAVDALLVGPAAPFSLDWIKGETEPRRFEPSSVVPAGAILEGSQAVEAEARQPLSESVLLSLLRFPSAHLVERRDARSRFWDRFTRAYVAGVLVVAALALVFSLARGTDWRGAMRIVSAVLIVTCPCAFGIATPLAYEIVLSRLRSAGLFVRSFGFLDRARRVRKVVFDKTGTLTTGILEIAQPEELSRLSRDDARILFNLAVQSTHPKSVALARALELRSFTFDPSFDVHLQPGLGVSVVSGGREYRLGEPEWVTGRASPHDLAYGVNGLALALVSTRETLRSDARAEIARLGAEGYEVWILSGDSSQRVVALAESCGVPAERALSERSPRDKAEFIRTYDCGDVLMVGDGINDSLALADAFCSATPAVERPLLAAKSDFYFTTSGLRPIRLALRAARALRGTVIMNLVLALVYNVVAVGLAVTGALSPLVCAIVMPISSLATLSATTLSLSEGRMQWKS